MLTGSNGIIPSEPSADNIPQCLPGCQCDMSDGTSPRQKIAPVDRSCELYGRLTKPVP